jgi:hypothetical protein
MEQEEQIYIKLFHTLNYLSKRLSPQRDESRLSRSPQRGEWSVREIVMHLRDHEAAIYPKLHRMAYATHPDLSRIGPTRNSDYRPDDSTLTVLSQFRRTRISTISLLRELPLDAWERTGIDTDDTIVSIRQMAIELIRHDGEHLAQVDATLLARNAMPFNVDPIVAD